MVIKINYSRKRRNIAWNEKTLKHMLAREDKAPLHEASHVLLFMHLHGAVLQLAQVYRLGLPVGF